MRWDIFCKVIDNLGDVGVCWRFCADLARRGERVRLWVDQPEPLRWMAPGALEGQVPGVHVLHWTTPLAPGLVESLPTTDVWVEAFGCDPALECIQHLAERLGQGQAPPVWINLEYLSAERYVERSHRLPSPVMSGPLKGLTKWFFYPGFTPATGGLLREADLQERQATFNADDWLCTLGLPLAGERRVSLVTNHLPCLPCWQAGQDPVASDWLVTPGRATQAVTLARTQNGEPGSSCQLHAMPALTQRDFDHLLWSCGLNCVRGEDSLVRALWAGQPFVWHIYPQHDDAHHANLDAFLDWLQAPPSLRAFHRLWRYRQLRRGLARLGGGGQLACLCAGGPATAAGAARPDDAAARIHRRKAIKFKALRKTGPVHTEPRCLPAICLAAQIAAISTVPGSFSPAGTSGPTVGIFMKIAQELRAGNVIMHGKDPMIVLKTEYARGGRGAATVRLKLKALLNNMATEVVCRADDKMDQIILDRRSDYSTSPTMLSAWTANTTSTKWKPRTWATP
jgi:uncharacterized repeat protein (TIGR03837 family)